MKNATNKKVTPAQQAKRDFDAFEAAQAAQAATIETLASETLASETVQPTEQLAIPTVDSLMNMVQQLQQQIASSAKPAAPNSSVKSAKQYIRELLSVDGAALTLDELCAASGKTAVNVRTALSDLRSVKYAGNAGVFITASTKALDGKTRYQQSK